MPRATTGLSYLTFSLVVLGSLIFAVFVIVPQWSTYQEARDKFSHAKEKRDERAQFLQSIDSRKQELDGYARDVVALRVAFPETFSAENMFATLQGIGSGAGASILEVTEPKKVQDQRGSSRAREETEAAQAEEEASSPSDMKSLERWDTTLKMRGTYPQLRTFIRDLENTLLLSDVQSLEIQSSAVNKDAAAVSDVLEAKLTVRTYVQLYPK